MGELSLEICGKTDWGLEVGLLVVVVMVVGVVVVGVVVVGELELRYFMANDAIHIIC